MLTDETEAMVQLATRVPKTLHRGIKLHCVKTETSLMTFVVEALQEKLAREAVPEKRRATSSR
jgi:predicted HicB family RNase H-like nuclease